MIGYPAPEQPAHEHLRSRILGQYLERLRDLGSPLVEDGSTAQETLTGAELVLGAIFPSLPSGTSVDASSSSIGKARAMQRIHPRFSLEASGVLFETALAVMQEQIPHSMKAEEVLVLVGRLQTAIMDRVVPASTDYVNVLVDKVEKSNLHERLSVSRHLHDNVAHGIAAAIQRLHLGRRSAGSGQTLSREIGQALTVLQETLLTVRDVATTLRTVVGDRHLDAALAELLEDASGYSGRIELLTSENVSSLSAHFKEELFVILREGIRNALQHAAGMRILRVGVEIGATEVMAFVEDDGSGFSDSPRIGSRIGLQSMKERTEMLGGSLTLHQSKDTGCRVSVRIPAVDGRPVILS